VCDDPIIVPPPPLPTVTNIGICWEAPTAEDGTPLTDLAGFKVYWGTASRVYPNVVDVGMALEYLVELPYGFTYYFAVTAYSTSGDESAYSEEVVFIPSG